MAKDGDGKHHCAYKFRLYPNREQKRYFKTNFEACRFVYNYFLDQRIKAYEATQKTLRDGSPNPSYDPEAKTLTYFDTTKMFTQLKRNAFDDEGSLWLYDADATALQQALRHLDKS